MADIITQEKLIELKRAREEALESDIPYPIVKGDAIAVVGDANKTELNKHDFTLVFIVPDENGEYKAEKVLYKDVYLKPRHAVTVQRLMTALQPLFFKVKEAGTVEELSDKEMLEVATLYEGNVLDQIYRLVQVVLGVDAQLVDFIEPDSALAAFRQIMKQFPDIAKASESFFGLSSGKKTDPYSNG